MIGTLRNGMKTTPRIEWMKTQEPNLAEYREELSRVSKQELTQVKNPKEDVDAASNAPLIFACGRS